MSTVLLATETFIRNVADLWDALSSNNRISSKEDEFFATLKRVKEYFRKARAFGLKQRFPVVTFFRDSGK